jgi:hypothetical protein
MAAAREPASAQALASGEGLAVKTWTRQAFDAHARDAELMMLPYTVNGPGMMFLRVCAALLWLVGVGIYAWTGFAKIYWGVAGVMLVLGGLYLLGLVAYWGHAAKVAMLAFDDASLFVADARKAEQIPWRLLTPQSAGFGDTEQDAPTGILHMHIAGKPITLRLFNAFMWLEDYPTFLVELLTQIKRNKPDAIAPQDAPQRDARTEQQGEAVGSEATPQP